jgi:hypothetical protein
MTGKAKKPKNETVNVTNARTRKLAAKSPEPTTPSREKPAKDKRIRGDFSMPLADYELIAALKATSRSNGRPVKKNELLRAGLHALRAMSSTQLMTMLAALASTRDAEPSASNAKPVRKKKPAL